MAGGLINFEISQFPGEVREMANGNERDLASCAGHDFRALNQFIYNSHFACTRCQGVVDYLTALRFGAQMTAPYYERIAQAAA